MDEVYIPVASQKRLLSLARDTLEASVCGAPRTTEEVDDPHLQTREYGVFVTLYKAQELRGCVGRLVPSAPLFESVMDMTEAAAARDSRVTPVRADELEQIHIDISILSSLEMAANPLSLQVGKHGLHIAQGSRRGVLLPQVATEHQWDIKKFLEQTCMKAGLGKNAWREPDTQVSSFTTLVIEE
jgi:AmmeMemoRadiSam system protein A